MQARECRTNLLNLVTSPHVATHHDAEKVTFSYLLRNPNLLV